jgi:glycosyltransferase involved in cell wall biosynthesis
MRARDFSKTGNRPVTVLMTAYNAEKTVGAAIWSILEQTFSNFYLLVVDDGSTDETGAIVRDIARTDDRVLYYAMEHAGLCTAANAGLAVIQSRYVARMDADDISDPTRLARQLDFLLVEPDVKVLGTHAYTIANNGRRITRIGDGPTTKDQYQARLKSRKPFFFLNSSVLAVRDALLDYGGYRWDDFPADDVALYTRIAQDHLVLTLPEPLVDYRLTPGGITAQHQFRMLVQFAKMDHWLRRDCEIDFESFLRWLDGHPLAKLRMRWGSVHKLNVRNGAYCLFNGEPLKGLIYLLCGAAMEPHRGLQKLIRAYR